MILIDGWVRLFAKMVVTGGMLLLPLVSSFVVYEKSWDLKSSFIFIFKKERVECDERGRRAETNPSAISASTRRAAE